MAPPRNRRPGYSRRAQYGFFLGYVLAAAGALVGALLLVLSHVNPAAFASLRGAAGDLTAPLSRAANVVKRSVSAAPTAISAYIAAGSQNANLRGQLERTRTELIEARGIAHENHRLKRLLAFRDGSVDSVVTARLISSSVSSARRFGVLNAGSADGVRIGQPVRGPDGLIGRVVEGGLTTARVLLLTDPESVVPVRRVRDGMPGIVSGRGDGTVELRALAAGASPFARGDIVVTSGTGGIFAPNIPVAQVVRRTGDSAIARAFAQPGTLDMALVQHAFMPAPVFPVRPTVKGGR